MKIRGRLFIYFYPRPPRGGRPKTLLGTLTTIAISIHALREEGDAADAVRQPLSIISIHALREEGDQEQRRAGRQSLHFYPRPPRGGRPDHLSVLTEMVAFLSTPSARRATGCSFCHVAAKEDFYPRPPRGGRQRNAVGIHNNNNFYPRPPRGGRHFCWDVAI